jgi:hypothetical protein
MKDGKQDDLPFMLSRLQDALSGLGSANNGWPRTILRNSSLF